MHFLIHAASPSKLVTKQRSTDTLSQGPDEAQVMAVNFSLSVLVTRSSPQQHGLVWLLSRDVCLNRYELISSLLSPEATGQPRSRAHFQSGAALTGNVTPKVATGRGVRGARQALLKAWEGSVDVLAVPQAATLGSPTQTASPRARQPTSGLCRWLGCRSDISVLNKLSM